MKRPLGLALLLATISAFAAGCYVRDRGAVVVHDDDRRFDHPEVHHEGPREEHHEEHHEGPHEDHHEGHHDDHHDDRPH